MGTNMEQGGMSALGLVLRGGQGAGWYTNGTRGGGGTGAIEGIDVAWKSGKRCSDQPTQTGVGW